MGAPPAQVVRASREPGAGEGRERDEPAKGKLCQANAMSSLKCRGIASASSTPVHIELHPIPHGEAPAIQTQHSTDITDSSHQPAALKAGGAMLASKRYAWPQSGGESRQHGAPARPESEGLHSGQADAAGNPTTGHGAAQHKTWPAAGVDRLVRAGFARESARAPGIQSRAPPSMSTRPPAGRCNSYNATRATGIARKAGNRHWVVAALRPRIGTAKEQGKASCRSGAAVLPPREGGARARI